MNNTNECMIHYGDPKNKPIILHTVYGTIEYSEFDLFKMFLDWLIGGCNAK